MKKMLLLAIIFLMVVPSMLFATKLSSKAQSEILVFNNMAEQMDFTQKTLFYNQNKKNLTAPLLLNIFLGCGIGSYVAGDTTGGTIALVGELCSYAVYFYGYGTILKAISSDDGSYASKGYNLMMMSLISLAGFRIYEIVRACTYTAEYNKQLSNALYSSSVQVGIAPVIENNEVKLGLSARVSF